jgi:hypothetical protein
VGKNGYPIVSINQRGKRSIRCYIHRLVLLAFIGQPLDEQDCCRHLDGDKTNNHLSNLCWGTWEENIADSRRHGTLIQGEKTCTCKLTIDQVRKIRELVSTGLTHKEVAKVFQLSPRHVGRIVHGLRWGWLKECVSKEQEYHTL